MCGARIGGGVVVLCKCIKYLFVVIGVSGCFVTYDWYDAVFVSEVKILGAIEARVGGSSY